MSENEPNDFSDIPSVELDQGFVSTLSSLLFWGTFLVASAMYAPFALAPSLATFCRVEQQYLSLEEQQARRSAEIAHMRRVEAALRSDPDFVRRLADREFGALGNEIGRFDVREELGYDARVPRVSEQNVTETAESWSALIPVELLEMFASDGTFRTRWGVATLFLYLFAFVCLSDGFTSGAIGRGMVLGLVAIAKRYQTSA
ncbi:hypothetical protein KOR42_01380 [Thalassoglobus neptunius]|uniref:Septum formation initiator n=1 Tax=Thalassoglobus neptunius TaxID=1938619 RepID=A0A5C5X3J7_9PLAN|nr:hypothetical protein [Thalassoglobus neptunius]TWT56783.1 hypothetical protein KOR42_01380 [Thalassoglobus neptunius]